MYIDRMEKIKIALAIGELGTAGQVSSRFGAAERLLLVASDSGEILDTLERQGRSDIELARRVLDWNCECLLCGPLEKAPFLIIADEGGVTRYDASGLDFSEALRRFSSGTLPLIRDHIGGVGCQSAGAGECHEH